MWLRAAVAVAVGRILSMLTMGCWSVVWQAEYVPLPVMEATFDMQPLLTDLLLSILPNVSDPRIVAMTLG